MTDKEIIIDGVDVSECNYVILPKKQCPMKSMPYAKETSCIACKEHNTKRNFCKNNPNCYYKQLKLKEQECEKINLTNERLVAEKYKLNLIIGRLLEASGYDTNTASAEDFEDVYEQMRYEQQQLNQYKQALDEIEEFCVIYSDNPDAYETVYKHILNIINKVKEK